MASSTTCAPCGTSSIPDASNETLASTVDNFIEAFFGSVQKTVVDGAVEWTLPCDLDEGLEGNPRADGEGLACYFLRLLQEGAASVNDGVLTLPSIAADPDPVVGYGQIYVKSGALYFQSPGGTITPLAPA